MRKPSTTAKKDGADDGSKEGTTSEGERGIGVENADSAAASVAMEEGDVAKRGEKREREETGGEEEEDRPSAKRQRTTESKEPGPVTGENKQLVSELQPSYAVDSRNEESMSHAAGVYCVWGLPYHRPS